MAARGAGLSYLAIGTILLVVVGSMHLGIQFSRGELLDREPPTALETELRDALRSAVDAARAERGLDPAQRGVSARVTAQATASELAGMDYYREPTAVGLRPETNPPLPNQKGFCYQLPAKLTVDRPGWSDGGEASVPPQTLRAVARDVVGLFARNDGVDVLRRTNSHKHGLGVAVRDGVVYVVYRTCDLGY